MPKLNVALVGLGFGSVFAPIYRRHPDVGRLVLCDAKRPRVTDLTQRIGFDQTLDSLDEVLADASIDAVHLNTGIPDHARHAISVLDAGKHCACTVPMATSLDDIRAVVAARRRSGKNYMMMETQLYSRDFLHALELRDEGFFGRLQFLSGAHFQDMENWAPYWAGLPPMWYATHAVAPCLAFAGTRARNVRCLGSGWMRPELRARHGNPFPMETAIFDLVREDPLAMEVTRALFHSARGYSESFSFYGEDATFEAPQVHGEPPVVFRLSQLGAQAGSRVSTEERIYLRDYAHRLPPEIAGFTGAAGPDARGEHPSVKHGGGHGGSHPHLVHEFLRSIVEGRPPAIDEIKAADWSAPGICAHASAMQGGTVVEIPAFLP
ncbi:MAG: oxidoreductase [Verrucomicrobia bacterium]|nr:oxidoreductase [Verrucomicrobiota bacterium]